MTVDEMRATFHLFQPKVEKILEAILLLLEEAAGRGWNVTQYDIVKSLFLADKDHLDEYGRPVTFDNYWAMEHGPVGDAAYDMLKPGYDWSKLGLEAAPWLWSPTSGRKAHFSLPARPANRRRLSGSDVNALLASLERVKSLQFGRTRQLTHRNASYVAAWGDGSVKSVPMDPRLIPQHRDDDLIDDLIHASRHAA